MKIRPYVLAAIVILASLGFNALESKAAESKVPGYLAALMGEVKPEGDIILEVGAMPSPPPSRRQIIDADKGAVCLQCHRMPYPVAPQKSKKEGEKPLSSVHCPGHSCRGSEAADPYEKSSRKQSRRWVEPGW